MKFGIYDTTDNCWIGDDSGPALYDDEMVARLAAEVMSVRLGYYPKPRLAHRKFPKQKLRLRDTIPTSMSNLKALRGLEEGRFLSGVSVDEKAELNLRFIDNSWDMEKKR